MTDGRHVEPKKAADGSCGDVTATVQPLPGQEVFLVALPAHTAAGLRVWAEAFWISVEQMASICLTILVEHEAQRNPDVARAMEEER